MIDFRLLGRTWAMLYRMKRFDFSTDLSPEDYLREQLANAHRLYITSSDQFYIRKYNEAADGFAEDMDRVGNPKY